MLQELINHNSDLKSLLDEGYDLIIRDGYLLIQNVPYVSSKKEINYGTIVSTLNLSGNKILKPETHVVFFKGEVPCKNDGQPLVGILNSSKPRTLTASIQVDHLFSSKPSGGYVNYYHKMKTYLDIIMSPAFSIDKNLSASHFKSPVTLDVDSVFNYIDTNSTRAGINNVSDKVAGQKIGIIGLGGTGSYILDLVSKNPVKEIHLFDDDDFLQHNAFRTPGAADVEELNAQIKKVEYLAKVYSKMHKGIFVHKQYVNSVNVQDVKGLDFVFICVDKGRVKKIIIDELLKNSVPFVDVGMGVELVDNQLIGTVRVTAGSKNKNNHLQKRISFNDGDDDEYNSNIQIAELNALNASLAVIKWKKIFCFYQDYEKEFNTSYSINVNMLLSEDHES